MKTKAKTPVKKTGTKKKTTEERTVIFPEGIMVFNPHEKAPDFVKAEVIISIDQFDRFLKQNEVTSEHEKYGEQIKLTLKESKDGKPYFEVNMYGVN